MKLFRFIFKDRSLSYKFGLISALPIIIGTIFIVLFIINSLESSIIAKTKARSTSLIKLAALSMSNPFVIYNKDLLDNFVDSLGKEKNTLYAMIVDSIDKRILAHSNHEKDGDILKDSPQTGELSGETRPNGDRYELSSVIIIGDRDFAAIKIGFSLTEVLQEITALRRSIITIAAVALFLGIALSILFSRIISNPLRTLARQTERIGTGDFSQKIAYESKDAIGQLAIAFNKMSMELRSNLSILRENEAKYRALFEASNDAVFVMDKEMFLECNDQTLKIFGCTREDIIGQSPLKFSPPTQPNDSLSKESAFENIKAALNGKHRRFYWQHIRLDGSTFDAEVSLNPTRIANKDVVQAVVQDISERKRAEEERERHLNNIGKRIKELGCIYGVAKSIQKAETLEEVFRDVVTLIPPGWQYPEITRAKVRFGNKEYVSRLFEETVWKLSSDIIVSGEHCGAVEVYYLKQRPELDEGLFLKEERQLIDGISRSLSEAVERARANERIKEYSKNLEGMVQERTSELEDTQDAMLNLVEDLNNSKQDLEKSKRELETQQAYLEQLFEASTEAIAFINEKDHVARINSQFIELFGFTPEELLGRSLDDTIIPESRHSEGKGIKKELRKGQRKFHETLRQRKDGSLVDVSITGMPIRIKGEEAGVYAIYCDISARKKAEKDLRQNMEELERFSSLAVGREKQMVRLKAEINELLGEMGRPEKYKIVV